jgi:hypothetical protein
MTYRVILTANAKGDLRRYYLRAAEHAPVTALRWLSRFEAALATLAPQRCSLAPENDAVEEEIRQKGKKGQVQFVRSILRAVPENWTCPLFRILIPFPVASCFRTLGCTPHWLGSRRKTAGTCQ